MVESDLVQGLFEFPAAQLIVDEGLFGQEMQVHLKRLSDKVATEILEDRWLSRLAAKKRKHTPWNTDNREMFIILQVVVAGPLKNAAHLCQVLIILEAKLSITGDIDAVDATKFLLQRFLIQGVVNWYDASTSSLQEIDMRCFNETRVVET